MLFPKRYYFEESTFTYQPVVYSRRQWLQKLGWAAGAGLVGAALFLVLSMAFYGNLEEVRLTEAQTQLKTKLGDQASRLMALERRLDRIHEKDNGFFRSILNTGHIAPAVWQGGVGGAPISQSRIPLIQNADAVLARIAHKTDVQRSSFANLLALAHDKKSELRQMPAIRPCQGRHTSGYGWRANPFHGGSEFHQGIDFSARIGTPVYATGDGVVITASDKESGYGKQIEIRHGSGYVTKYAHLSAYKVSPGDSVARGQLIGLVGNTGYSTGPHLHYEVIRNGVKINPIDFFYNN